MFWGKVEEVSSSQLLGVFGVAFGDFALGGVAFVNVDAVFESYFFVGTELVIAGTFGLRLIHVVLAEGIRGKEAVIARVPAGGMPRIGRMIEDGDADCLLLHRPIVVDPLGFLAPHLAILDPFAIYQV